MHPVARTLRIACGILLAWLLLGAGTAAAEALQGRVTWVYDGDTIRVAKLGKVRLLGIDAPEREASDRDRYYLRQGISEQTLRRMHHEARRRLVALCYHQTVTLETGDAPRDAYGRLLAYVALPDGRMVNRLLVEEGYAAVYRRFNFAMKGEFLQAEREARKEERGLWERPAADRD